jgi:fucose permease
MVSMTRQAMLDAGASRRALSGFFLSGLLFSLLGAILPAWGYHLSSEYSTVGAYFLSLNIGILLSIRVSSLLLARRGTSFTLAISAAAACGALLCLAALSGPVPAWWRMLGLLWLGVSAGVTNTAVFHAISTPFEHDHAATINLAGTAFGLGCLVTALLVAGTFYVYTVPSILILLATVPGFFAVSYARWRSPQRAAINEPSIRQAFQDFKSPGAVLFSLLLFFQFGNEWAIAGWLPLFLTQRVGISPESSLLMLALYWFALMVGRLLAQSVLPHVSHGRLLGGSVLAALFGCVILSSTNNSFGAVAGILFIGGGFAAIYPLVVEKIGYRFPCYHPGFFNGIFSFALTGGLIAPWSLGYFADLWGIGVVMLLPLFGSFLVLVLLLLLWLESKLTQPGGHNSRRTALPDGPR